MYLLLRLHLAAIPRHGVRKGSMVYLSALLGWLRSKAGCVKTGSIPKQEFPGRKKVEIVIRGFPEISEPIQINSLPVRTISSASQLCSKCKALEAQWSSRSKYRSNSLEKIVNPILSCQRSCHVSSPEQLFVYQDKSRSEFGLFGRRSSRVFWEVSVPGVA